MTAFCSLLTSLPTGNSTLRMRVWRALKNTGCAVLRDGVYVLPAGAPQVPLLAEAESAVKVAGGFAMTAELNITVPAQLAHVRSLFDRAREYGVLVEKIGTAKRAVPRLGRRRAGTLVRRRRRRTPRSRPLSAKRRDCPPRTSHIRRGERCAGWTQRSFAIAPGPHAKTCGWTVSPASG